MTANVSCLVKVNLLICEGSKTNRNGGGKMTLEEQINITETGWTFTGEDG